MRKASIIFGTTGKTFVPNHMIRTDPIGSPTASKVRDQDLSNLTNVNDDVQNQLEFKNPKLIDGVSIRTINNLSVQGSSSLDVDYEASIPAGVFLSAQQGSIGYPNWLEYVNARYPSDLSPDLSLLITRASPIVTFTSDSTVLSAAPYFGVCSPNGTIVLLCKEQFSGEMKEVWYSKDDGDSWYPYPYFIDLPVGFTEWETMKYEGNRLYLISKEARILFSDDDGFSWVTAPDSLGTLNGAANSVVGFLGGMLCSMPRILVDESTPTTHRYNFHRLWFSTDGGFSWKRDTRSKVGIIHYQPGELVTGGYISPFKCHEVVSIGGSLTRINVKIIGRDLADDSVTGILTFSSTDRGISWEMLPYRDSSSAKIILGCVNQYHYNIFYGSDGSGVNCAIQTGNVYNNELGVITSTMVNDFYKAHVFSKECFIVACASKSFAFTFHNKNTTEESVFNEITLPSLDVLVFNSKTSLLHCIKRDETKGVGNYFATSSRFDYKLKRADLFEVNDAFTAQGSPNYSTYVKVRNPQ